MTAKFSASADGTKVYLGNASENALEINATSKKIGPVSPFTFDFSNLPFSKATNGYMTLPNGFIVQWGSNGTSSTSSTTVTFPTAFTAPPKVVATSGETPVTQALIATATSVGLTGFSLDTFGVSGARVSIANCQWIAIGY